MSFGFSVGDVFVCSKLALSAYNALRDAPKEFQELSLEVLSLNQTLRALGEEASSPTSIILLASPQRQESLRVLLDNCSKGLAQLELLVSKYRSIGSPETKSRFLDHVRFAAKEKQGPRDKLAIHTASINIFLTSLTHSSLGRLEILIKNALRPATGSFSVAASTSSFQKAWSTLGQDLVWEGFESKDVEKYGPELLAYMRHLRQGGEVYWKNPSQQTSTAPPTSGSGPPAYLAPPPPQSMPYGGTDSAPVQQYQPASRFSPRLSSPQGQPPIYGAPPPQYTPSQDASASKPSKEEEDSKQSQTRPNTVGFGSTAGSGQSQSNTSITSNPFGAPAAPDRKMNVGSPSGNVGGSSHQTANQNSQQKPGFGAPSTRYEPPDGNQGQGEAGSPPMSSGGGSTAQEHLKQRLWVAESGYRPQAQVESPNTTPRPPQSPFSFGASSSHSAPATSTPQTGSGPDSVPQQQSSTGELFNTPPEKPEQFGSFESSAVITSTGATSVSGLFGNEGSQQSLAGSVFGNSQQQGTSGSLFGNNQQPQSTGRLFGAPRPSTTGSLFGAPMTGYSRGPEPVDELVELFDHIFDLDAAMPPLVDTPTIVETPVAVSPSRYPPEPRTPLPYPPPDSRKFTTKPLHDFPYQSEQDRSGAGNTFAPIPPLPPLPQSINDPNRRLLLDTAKRQLANATSQMREAQYSGDPYHAAALTAKEIPEHVQYLRTAGLGVIQCDVCHVPVENVHFHCDVCANGDWDVCTICVGEGTGCLGGHRLVKRYAKAWAGDNYWTNF